MGATNPPTINKISVVDTANALLENKSFFTTPDGVLAGLSPNSVSAENVGLKDVNSLVNAQVSGVNLVNSIELAGPGTITEPVNIETALGLLDTRISNGPTPSSLSVKDDAQAIISSAAKFATNAELGDVTVVTATGASVADKRWSTCRGGDKY